MITSWVVAIIFHIQIAAACLFIGVNFTPCPIHLLKYTRLEAFKEYFVTVILNGKGFVLEKLAILDIGWFWQIDQNADFLTITTAKASREQTS